MHTLTIDGSQLQLEQNEANTIKGFGLLSCNNTSRLLMDYKWEHPKSISKCCNTYSADNTL